MAIVRCLFNSIHRDGMVLEGHKFLSNGRPARGATSIRLVDPYVSPANLLLIDSILALVQRNGRCIVEYYDTDPRVLRALEIAEPGGIRYEFLVPEMEAYNFPVELSPVNFNQQVYAGVQQFINLQNYLRYLCEIESVRPGNNGLWATGVRLLAADGFDGQDTIYWPIQPPAVGTIGVLDFISYGLNKAFRWETPTEMLDFSSYLVAHNISLGVCSGVYPDRHAVERFLAGKRPFRKARAEIPKNVLMELEDAYVDLVRATTVEDRKKAYEAMGEIIGMEVKPRLAVATATTGVPAADWLEARPISV